MPDIIFTLGTTLHAPKRRHGPEFSTMENARRRARELNAQRRDAGERPYIAIREHVVGWNQERCRAVHVLDLDDTHPCGNVAASDFP